MDWADPTLEASYDESKRGGCKTRQGGAWGGRRCRGGGGRSHAPEGSNFFPRSLASVYVCVTILLSLSTVKVKLILAFMLSKQGHVTRA